MDTDLPLDKMTTSDKLRALEKIWDDLQRNTEEVPSPAWHEDVLQAREKRFKEGTSEFLEWSKAKANIRNRT